MAKGLRLRQVRFGYFCLLCYCACAETATVVLLALTLYKLKFSVPGFVYNLSFGLVLSHFPHFYCACAETARILLPVKFLTQNLKSPWTVSYSNTNFDGASAKIYTCFARKTAFVMQNFRNLGDIGGGGENFLSKPPKGTYLPDFTRFELSIVQSRSRVFAPDECTKKIGTLQKVTEKLYFTYLRGIPHATKFNQNWHTSRGCRRNQSHQV